MTNTHEYTLTLSTHPAGRRYGVNFNGSPLLAVTPERDRALTLLRQQLDRATFRRQPVHLLGWNGDTAHSAEVVELVGGRFAVLVNGVQWGPDGYPVESNGATRCDWPDPWAALIGWLDEQ